MEEDFDNAQRCRLCGKTCSRFARSHILPWGFFKCGHYANDMSLFCDTGGSKRLRKGVYDDHILCDDCEHRYFHDPDTHAIKIYRDLTNATYKSGKKSTGEPYSYYVIDDVTRKLLRAFFASVLWRCSVARRDVCDVNIGEIFERRIAYDLMYNGNFDYIDAFGLRLNSGSQDELVQGLNEGCMMPVRTRFRSGNNVANGYNVYLPGYKFCVSLDQRRHPFCFWREGQVLVEGKASSPSLREEYDDTSLLIFESSYPASMVDLISSVCARRMDCR